MNSKSSTYCRSASIGYKHLNEVKMCVIDSFLHDYELDLRHYVNYLWNNRIDIKGRVLDVVNGLYDCPSMLSTVGIERVGGRLTARAVKCAATQACGIVQSVLNKRLKDVNKATYCYENGYNISARLQERLCAPLTQPKVRIGDVGAELNTLCASFEKSNTSKHFFAWIKLSSIFKDSRGESTEIPIKIHKRAMQWYKLGVMKSGILLTRKSINIVFEIERKVKLTGDIVGIDQGLNTCLTISNGFATKQNKHGKTLSTIIDKMCRQRNGSKANKRTQIERDNFIRETTNNIDFRNIKLIYLEKINHINYGRNVSEGLKHFTAALIRDTLKVKSEENNVYFTEVPNVYNSQRCSNCGWTQDVNRKGKGFNCKKCKYSADADYNASLNVKIRPSLPKLPYEFSITKPSKKGFLWNPNQILTYTGEELVAIATPKQSLIPKIK